MEENTIKKALLDRYSYMMEFPRTGKRGRGKKPKQMPSSKLKYAQIIKRKDGDKPLEITKKIIFGDPKTIDESEISTSHRLKGKI